MTNPTKETCPQCARYKAQYIKLSAFVLLEAVDFIEDCQKKGYPEEEYKEVLEALREFWRKANK